MSVPLDRLYHYLGDCVNHDLLIYRWMPHGSTKLEDFCMLRGLPVETDQYHRRIYCHDCNDHAVMICHDQEPGFQNRYSILKNFQKHDQKYKKHWKLKFDYNRACNYHAC
jgi:hypothetical protein